jgi:uncharacterized paraquat-inducible protein A
VNYFVVKRTIPKEEKPMRNRLQQFFYGRNGLDQLGIVAIVLALIVLIITRITGIVPLSLLYLGLVLYALFRATSQQVHNRQRENARFLTILKAIAAPFKLRVRMFRERKTHRYLRCPKCGRWLRVPKGKGKIAISCSRCHERFIRKV